MLNEEMKNYIRDSYEETLQLIRDLCAIPAPSNHEELRAEFCKKWFIQNGFEGVFLDEALNVIAPVNLKDDQEPLTVVMAHTDTVFPDREPMPCTEDGENMYSPGVTDDTANLAVMMICCRYFKNHFPAGKGAYLFIANSGEEGLGNLKGTRKIMETYGSRVKEFITLDCCNFTTLYCDAVGSHRYKVTVRTEGGHSFASFGNRNAIATLASMINLLYSVKVPVEGNSRTTYNVGLISGGTSVNTIAQDAQMMYEYRSDNRNCLAKMQDLFEKTVETFRASGVEVEVEKVGDRPCASPVDPERFNALKSRAKKSLREVSEFEYEEKSASTDCNIPLSMGIPAIGFGVVIGKGAHTREESLVKESVKTGSSIFLNFLYQ